MIFKQDVHKFTFERGTEVEGRRLMEYSFQVPREHSSYIVEIPGSSVKRGYNGTVLADPVTGDVIRLMVKTGELPTVANACEISTNLALQMVQIGGQRVSAASAGPAAICENQIVTRWPESDRRLDLVLSIERHFSGHAKSEPG